MVSKQFLELLKSRGFTQVSFAKAIGVRFQTVNRWIHGTRKPLIDNIIRIAEVLNVSADVVVKCFSNDR